MPAFRTTPFEISIIDNNLLKWITRIGNSHFYEGYYRSLHNVSLLNSDTRLIITPAGILEYLGQTLPSIADLDNEDIRRDAVALTNQNPFNREEFNFLRKKLLDRIEAHLKQRYLYSKSKVTSWAAQQRLYTDPNIKDWIFEIIDDNTRNMRQRNIIYNRVALDRAYGYVWPSEMEDYIYPAYLADLHQAFEYKIGYGSMRGLRRIWNDFAMVVEKKLRENWTLGELSPDEIRRNISKINTALSFDSTGDFLDVEAIHYLCVGRFHTDDSLKPVLFSTQDPIDKFLIRLGTFKSFYKLSHESIFGDGSRPELQEGFAIIFNSDVQMDYVIKVEEVPPLLDHSANILIEDWLAEIKGRSSIEVISRRS